MNKIFRKLARLIIFAFVLIFLISNAIISLSYYNYFEKMMAAKLTQSVSTSSTAYIQSFFDTIKREALKLIEEEPLKGFLEGSAEPESTEDFLRYRTDVSASEFIEVYSAKSGIAVAYDEQGDYFYTGGKNPDLDFGDESCVFLPYAVPKKPGATVYGNYVRDYAVVYQKIGEDGSYIATGLCAHVTRSVILSGLILPENVSYKDIREGLVDNTDSNMYLVNPDGMILSDYFLKYAGQSLTDYDFYETFHNSAFDSDHRLFSYNESSYLMSCAYQPKPGLYVVGVIQKQDIIAAILPTLLILSLLILIALSVFCALCLLLLYRAFSPYEKLVQKVSETSKSELYGAELLGEAIQKGAAAEQKAYEMVLSDYLLDREIDLDTLSEIEEQYPGEYLPITCQIDDYESLSPSTRWLHTCREVAESIFCFMDKVLCVSLDKNKLLLILCGDSAQVDIEGVLAECRSTLAEAGVSTSYILGKAQSKLKDVKESYYDMQKIMFMSVCYGAGSIISQFSGEDHVEFPSTAVTTLIGCLNTCDREKISKLLDQIFDDFEGKKSSLISIYLHQITLSLISHIASFDSEQTLIDYQDILNRVTAASSLSAAKTLISQLCFDSCDYLASFQNKARGKQEVEAKIIEYLNEHYSDPNLSLTLLSNIFGYSPKYLGRIFKNYTNLFFTQYLTKLRMDKARDLVLNTEMPIAEIFESVGITTLQHFYRLFKKEFGYSPAAMRKHRGELLE
ncbi:MAG: helix-turn-helix domain-containing protein [Massilioclostridium sp.]|nr:helix-turn-helix domain-containing protein [Massilioclostridium sp.]